MKTGLVLGGIGIALAVAGCALFSPMGGHGSGTRVTISNDVNVTPSGSSCTVAAVPPISVTNGNSGTLVFHVKPASAFKFASNGIDFSKSGAPPGEFSPVNTSDTTWTIRDRNKTAGTFKYDVHVIPKAQGGVACMLDPTVFNDGTCTDGC